MTAHPTWPIFGEFLTKFGSVGMHPASYEQVYGPSDSLHRHHTHVTYKDVISGKAENDEDMDGDSEDAWTEDDEDAWNEDDEDVNFSHNFSEFEIWNF